MRASAPTSAWAARSEAERAEREAGQIRPCNPTNRRSCAAGINCQISAAPRRTRGEVTANTQAPSHVTHPHSAEARRCRSATKAAFSFGPCTARFSFPQEGKENGGCIAWPSSWQNSRPFGHSSHCSVCLLRPPVYQPAAWQSRPKTPRCPRCAHQSPAPPGPPGPSS